MIGGSVGYLRDLNMLSVLLRLFLAMATGGLLGIDRARKQRAAGFRTYMIVCVTAALTMLISQYCSTMLETAWAQDAAKAGAGTDVSRFGAQVISGIGFLGAGTIIINSRQQIKGLTTAAGLWASACMGLAIGAGFYECVLFSFLLILLCVCFLPALENKMAAHSPNLNLYFECRSLEAVGRIIREVKRMKIAIYDLDISREHGDGYSRTGVVFSLMLSSGTMRGKVLSRLSEIDGVLLLDEI